jgi:MYXO-CTERM domain-containing protein
MRSGKWSVACASLLASLALSRLAMAGDPIKVACIGDSITAGNQNYPTYLQQKLGYGYQVNNYGVSGRTMLKQGNAPYWNEQAFIDSSSGAPDLVIIMLGTNDAKPYNWVYKDQFVSNYEEMVNHYRGLASHPAVFLNTCPTAYNAGAYDIDPSVVNGEIAPLIKQMGTQMGCAVIDVNAATANMPVSFPDNIHPNAAGSQVIAQTVFDGLMSDSSLPRPVVSQARSRPVTVSSVADNSPGENAVDADLTTRWSSAYADGEWIFVDLGSVESVTGVYLNWESAYASAYSIQISSDAASWTDVYSTTQGLGGIEHVAFTRASRYVKVLCEKRATAYGCSLWDFVVTTTSGTPSDAGTAVDAGGADSDADANSSAGAGAAAGSGATSGPPHGDATAGEMPQRATGTATGCACHAEPRESRGPSAILLGVIGLAATVRRRRAGTRSDRARA